MAGHYLLNRVYLPPHWRCSGYCYLYDSYYLLRKCLGTFLHIALLKELSLWKQTSHTASESRLPKMENLLRDDLVRTTSMRSRLDDNVLHESEHSYWIIQNELHDDSYPEQEPNEHNWRTASLQRHCTQSPYTTYGSIVHFLAPCISFNWAR